MSTLNWIVVAVLWVLLCLGLAARSEGQQILWDANGDVTTALLAATMPTFDTQLMVLGLGQEAWTGQCPARALVLAPDPTPFHVSVVVIGGQQVPIVVWDVP